MGLTVKTGISEGESLTRKYVRIYFFKKKTKENNHAEVFEINIIKCNLFLNLFQPAKRLSQVFYRSIL